MKLLVAAALAGVGLAGVAPSVAGPVTVAPLHGATAIAAYGEVAVWSDHEATSRSWHLVVRSDGRLSTPSVPSAPKAIEADVGPDAAGVPTLAYVSCASDCDVVISNLDGSDPRTVPGSQRASHPSIWGDRVAWVRARNTVLISRWNGIGRRVLGGAPARKCYEPLSSPQRLVCAATSARTVEALALSPKRLALVDSFDVPGEIGGSGLPSEVRVEGTEGGPQRLVAILNPGEGGESWIGPSWWDGDLYFFKNGEGPHPLVYRFDPRDGRYADTRGHRFLSGFSIIDGHRAYETTEYSGGPNSCGEEQSVPCSVLISEPLSFKPTRAPVYTL
ncbi:MAG TPA: hypothetical protein VGY13_08305 [Solirubrobacteraceae bacterium]|jgi:hypothetical protein|nr:hypothetical protein [Solirubrobacteraceae bacterium]